jgi:hypothetical protein
LPDIIGLMGPKNSLTRTLKLKLFTFIYNMASTLTLIDLSSRKASAGPSESSSTLLNASSQIMQN